MRYLYLVLLSTILISCSCEQKESSYSKRDIMFMVYDGDKEASEVLPENIDAGIKCEDYGPGCRRGYIGRIRNLEMIFVEFDSHRTAREEAQRIQQYYVRNWVLDDVNKEPVLERFVRKYLKAVRYDEEFIEQIVSD